MYQQGLGISQDYTEAIKWYRKAAEQGYASAQNNLGVIHQKGMGVLQDFEEAVKWYRKAADQGVAGAQSNLSLMYIFGMGVPQDFVQAYMWINLAATTGDQRAIDARGIIAKDMTPSQIEEAQKLTQEWWAKHNK